MEQIVADDRLVPKIYLVSADTQHVSDLHILSTGFHYTKVNRGPLMRKLGLRSVAELVRLAERLGVPPVS